MTSRRVRRFRARPRVGYLARRIARSHRLVEGLEDIRRGFDDIARAVAEYHGHKAEQRTLRRMGLLH